MKLNGISMKQTAVEWLVKETPNIHWEDGYWADLFERAKEMEKQQIIDANNDGYKVGRKAKKFETAEQYYTETYETE